MARVHDLDGNLIFAHNPDRDIASDLFGVVNDNPDIITNVYRDDEWFMNRHRPEEMRFLKKRCSNMRCMSSITGAGRRQQSVLHLRFP